MSLVTEVLPYLMPLRWPSPQPEWEISHNPGSCPYPHYIADNPLIDGRLRPIEVDSGSGFGREGWEKLDWGYVVADVIEGRRGIGENLEQQSEATSGSRLADVDVGYAADTGFDIPS